MKLFAHPLEFGNCNKVRIWNLTCNKFVHKYTWQTPKGESCEKPNLNVDGYCLELWRLICLVLVIGTMNMFKDGWLRITFRQSHWNISLMISNNVDYHPNEDTRPSAIQMQNGAFQHPGGTIMQFSFVITCKYAGSTI